MSSGDVNAAGYTVAEIQAGLRDVLNVDMDTPAYVDGRRVGGALANGKEGDYTTAIRASECRGTRVRFL
jgi:hypothetical protein